MDTNAKQRAFTIYLLRSYYTEPAQVVTKPTKEYRIGEGKNSIGTLYVESRAPNPPRWAEFFAGHVASNDLGLVASSSAAFIVRSSDRLFAITFGHGRYLLDQDSIEDRFGLKVVLNSIPAERLKSIDKRSFDAIDSNSRVQASQEADAQDFGIDAEQDLLRAVTGIPNNPELGSRLSGRDALHAVVRCDIEDISQMLCMYYSKYLEETYKTQFPWVDNIKEIAVVSHLDELLVEAMNDIRTSDSHNRKCWLSVPEVLDWERIDGFSYSRRQHAPIHHDLHLPGFFRSLPSSELVTLEILQKRSAFAVDGDGIIISKWSIYKCVHCEVEISGSIYVLSAGRWYEITKDLADLVDSFYANLPRYQSTLPEYNDIRESAYCARVAGASHGKLLLMDQKFVRVRGRTNQIEFCDLYGDAKDLIHVKRYGSSSVLNHLFGQGLLSGECLKSLEGFSEELNKILPSDFKVPEQAIPRDVRDYTVVFAIISESKKPLELPFFARVSLRQVAKRLQSVNFSVCLAQISVSDDLSLVERLPVGRPKR